MASLDSKSLKLTKTFDKLHKLTNLLLSLFAVKLFYLPLYEEFYLLKFSKLGLTPISNFII